MQFIAIPVITLLPIRHDPKLFHALRHMMCGYTLLVPMNERVLNKSSKEHNKTGERNTHENKMTDNIRSCLLPIQQWLRGNSCTWEHYVLFCSCLLFA